MQDFQKVGQDVFEKSVKNAAAVTQSFQALALEMADVAKKNLEDGAAHFERLASVRSLDKAIELQSDYLKASYETGIQQATRFSTLFVDATKQMTRPYETAANAA